MADERDTELDEERPGGTRRLHLVKGSLEESTGPGARAAGEDPRAAERDDELAETPGAGITRDRDDAFDRDALDALDREDSRPGIDVNRTEAQVEADNRREDSAGMAGALRRDAGMERQRAYTDETRAADFNSRADEGGPEAGADRAMANWYEADARRQRSNAVADEHRADWYDADQHAAATEPMPTPTDGSQADARGAAVPPKQTPVARRGNRGRGAGKASQRDPRDLH
jgi:hypothetical protein